LLLCGDDMNVRLEAELICAIFMGIIWIYSHEKNMVFTLKNRIFRGCFVLITLSILMNIVTMSFGMNNAVVHPWLFTAYSYSYYALTPLATAMCQLYTIAFILEETEKTEKKFLIWSLIPYAAFLVVLISNPLTGVLFTVHTADGLTQGPWFQLNFIIHYIYSLIMLVTVFLNRKLISQDARIILLIFPTLIVLFVFIQQMLPGMMLSGVAATSILLIAYLYLQNKRIYEDQLTGLPNRMAYIKTLQVLVEKKRTMFVMAISLNDFKFINDKFGQSNGDLLLKNVATFNKTVAPLARIYRCGGDKFAVIFEKNQLEAANSDICRIADRFTQSWDIPGCTCHLGAAIGVAHCPTTTDNMGELVSMLESAVERAKTSGSAQPVFCDREVIYMVRHKHEIKERLSAALKHNGFEIYYQPLYSIEDGKFFEAEALLRLKDDDGRFLPPEEFIPIAEETGLIVDIGYMVIDKVCQYIRFLLKCGIEIDTISVNLSVVQLMKADIVPRLLQIIRGNGVSPSRIVFEITESILVSNYDIAAEKIKWLSESGIRFALDDFGTGYSNLTHVIDLPFHMVKIDKSLIWDSMTNEKCYILIRDLIRTFKNMNLMVIAEGVETPEHDAFVRLCGCDRIQGFRYARPMPISLASDYLGRSLPEIQS